ncbi:MAG: hypothetical protein ACRBFS_24390 [Aureispira sp.]
MGKRTAKLVIERLEKDANTLQQLIEHLKTHPESAALFVKMQKEKVWNLGSSIEWVIGQYNSIVEFSKLSQEDLEFRISHAKLIKEGTEETKAYFEGEIEHFKDSIERLEEEIEKEDSNIEYYQREIEKLELALKTPYKELKI